MVKQTSIIAYTEIKETLGERQNQVLNAFKRFGDATNLEISRQIGLPINQVTPRTNELVKIGLIQEIGKRECTISRRKAIEWGAR